jgi:hypothetical protein
MKVVAKRRGHKRPRHRTATVIVGSVSYNLSVGSVRSFAIRLSGAVFRALTLARHKRLNVTAQVPGGRLRVALVRLKPKPKGPPHKKRR